MRTPPGSITVTIIKIVSRRRLWSSYLGDAVPDISPHRSCWRSLQLENSSVVARHHTPPFSLPLCFLIPPEPGPSIVTFTELPQVGLYSACKVCGRRGQSFGLYMCVHSCLVLMGFRYSFSLSCGKKRGKGRKAFQLSLFFFPEHTLLGTIEKCPS